MEFQIACECAGSPLNPGQPGCMPLVGRDKFPIFMDEFNSLGVLNIIPTVLDEAALVAKLNETDPRDRWTVFPEMKNLAAPPAENETEDIDGVPNPTGEEIKQPITFEHTGSAGNPALKAAYDSRSCRDNVVVFATFKGQLNGMNDGNGNLRGIKVQNGTLSAQYAAPVKGTLQKMMVSYLVDELENEANRDYIPAASIAFPTKSWFTKQPLEILPLEISNTGQVTIVFKLNSLYGEVDGKSPIEGIVTADINDGVAGFVFNETTALTVAETLVESTVTPGTYTMTLGAAQTAADVIKIDVVATGYAMRSFRVTLG